ncbi:MAG: CheB methylesterase domain-containing protein [Oscillospiraceae bacterium]|nr:CheB methylesterase domain-containing protein [Oscillospiraceae bacterium]
MVAVSYSMLIMTEDSLSSLGWLHTLTKNGRYKVRRVGINTAEAAAAIDRERTDIVLIMTDECTTVLETWALRQATSRILPFVILCSKRSSGSTDTPDKLLTIYLCGEDGDFDGVDINIRLRIALNQAMERKIRRQKMYTEEKLRKNDASEKGTALPRRFDSRKIIAIGASMGGAQAISEVINRLPADMPGIVIVQHMPKDFTNMYAKRLDLSCKLRVVEARDNQHVEEGTVYIAPGDFHMNIVRAASGEGYTIKIVEGQKVTGHRPSVDVLFRSVAKCAGSNAMGIILTGMGDDGARGLLEMRKAGAWTVGQDAATSLVYGMPKVAFDMGAVCKQSPLLEVPDRIRDYANKTT